MYQKSAEKPTKKVSKENQDSLTGLLKKEITEAQITSRMKEKCRGALFLCDVDYIKRINEQYGHPVGDECLKQVARILSYMVYPNDILGRRRGAEFVIFTTNCQDVQQTEEYARRLDNRFCAGREKWNGKVPLSLTIVWAMREQGDTCVTLFDRADEKRRERKAASEDNKKQDQNAKDYYVKDIRQVRKDLREQAAITGAYCQNYETFKGIYRFLARGLIRGGQEACVILITLVDTEGGSPPLYEKDVLMERLGDNIGSTLRLGDVYTRYSSCQYLLLVINTTKSQVDTIVGRIREKFLADKFDNDILIHRCYQLQPARLGDMSDDGSISRGSGKIAGR